jgi:hypothetical protein
MINAYRERKEHLIDLGVNGRAVLNWILQKEGLSTWLRITFCEHHNETSDSIYNG